MTHERKKRKKKFISKTFSPLWLHQYKKLRTLLPSRHPSEITWISELRKKRQNNKKHSSLQHTAGLGSEGRKLMASPFIRFKDRRLLERDSEGVMKRKMWRQRPWRFPLAFVWYRGRHWPIPIFKYVREIIIGPNSSRRWQKRHLIGCRARLKATDEGIGGYDYCPATSALLIGCANLCGVLARCG